MQAVGAAWMMVSFNAGPLYVALIQTASALPFFVLALLAGVIGDIVDRRKLILFAEVWMACVAITLAGVTMAGRLSPVLLLVLTFALSAGDAFESPSWRAVLPELVSKADLPSQPRSTASNSPGPSHRSGARGLRHRYSRRWRHVSYQCGVFPWGHLRHSTLEATPSYTNDTS